MRKLYHVLGLEIQGAQRYVKMYDPRNTNVLTFARHAFILSCVGVSCCNITHNYTHIYIFIYIYMYIYIYIYIYMYIYIPR